MVVNPDNNPFFDTRHIAKARLYHPDGGEYIRDVEIHVVRFKPLGPPNGMRPEEYAQKQAEYSKVYAEIFQQHLSKVNADTTTVYLFSQSFAKKVLFEALRSVIVRNGGVRDDKPNFMLAVTECYI